MSAHLTFTYDCTKNAGIWYHEKTFKGWVNHSHPSPADILSKIKKKNLPDLIRMMAEYKAEIIILEKKMTKLNDWREYHGIQVAIAEDHEMLATIRSVYHNKMNKFLSKKEKKESSKISIEKPEKERLPLEAPKDETSENYGSYFGTDSNKSKEK